MSVAESISALFRLQAEGKISREEMSKKRRSLLASYAQLQREQQMKSVCAQGTKQRAQGAFGHPTIHCAMDSHPSMEALSTSPNSSIGNRSTPEPNPSRWSLYECDSDTENGGACHSQSRADSVGTFTHNPYSWATTCRPF